MSNLHRLIIICGLLIFASLAAANLGAQAQDPGYLITDYGFSGEFGIAVTNVDGSNVYNVLPNTQAAAPPGFVGGCSLIRTLTPRNPSMPLDGSVIAFESEGVPDRLHRVFLMNRDGTAPTQITFTDSSFPTAPDTYPAISPDGTKIAFLSTRTTVGTRQLFTVNADGSNLFPVTQETCIPGDCTSVYSMAWSPDSTQLVFAGHSPGLSCPFADGVMVINADGTGQRVLACGPGGPVAMDWSSDGLRIAFQIAYGLAGRDGLGINQVAPDGTPLHNITPGELGHVGDRAGMIEVAPGVFRYSPDGTRLAYEIADFNNAPQGISFINVDGTAKQDVIVDHNYHHLWWESGAAILRPTSLTLAPDPLAVGPTFGQQLSPVLKDSAGNILSRSAYGYCTGDVRFANPDQRGFVISPSAGGPATPMVVTNGGLSSNVITALPQSTDPPVSINPKAWDFGNQSVAIASAAQVFTLTNTGTTALNIAGITVTGANPSDFTLDPGASTCPIAGGVVDVMANCTINVIFTPGALGARSAQVQVADDAAGTPHTVALAGSGTP